MRASKVSLRLAACSAAFFTCLAPGLQPTARAQSVGFVPGVGVAPSGVSLGVTPTVSADRMYVRMGMDVGFNQVTGFTTYQVPAAVSGGGGGGGNAGGGNANAAAINNLLGNLGGGAVSGAMGNGGASTINYGAFGGVAAVSGVGSYGNFGGDPFNSMGGLNTYGGNAGPGSAGSFGQVQGFNGAGNFVGGAGTFGPAGGNAGAGPGGPSRNFIGNPLGSKGPRATLPGEGPGAMPSSNDPFLQAAEAPARTVAGDRGAQADGARMRPAVRGRSRGSRSKVLVRSPAQSSTKVAASRRQDGPDSPPAPASDSSASRPTPASPAPSASHRSQP
ncbi:hypothetical protein OJF2_39910 [Aquisphaera giovannonii]|uniref:Uncharacterized protein n=1 Tax=Aquisphaera giovannonii TaxID=406548 RepID=A0A5B9W5M8_9BACT|nr:hypothetical protein [Aquisphaera giovannonii]QEH35439.1 hypothetical protein OJF2_39910 [Aquisphaera giovannonii]